MLPLEFHMVKKAANIAEKNHNSRQTRFVG
jgi:hypothetical protein